MTNPTKNKSLTIHIETYERLVRRKKNGKQTWDQLVNEIIDNSKGRKK